MNKELYVYVDIDDTIVRTAGSKRIPIPDAIKHVRDLKRQGAVLFCWSSGGAEYAKSAAEEFGIAECFTAFLPKPNVLIDDQEISSWKRLLYIHPSGCNSETVEKYLRQLEN
jgi:phosphoglycolate phosphatase-like HAD superfamily hydrolase